MRMSNPERPRSSESDAAKTVTLTEKDLKDAARLFKLLVDPAMLGQGGAEMLAPRAGGGAREALISRARSQLRGRHIRKQYFGRDFFAEPAWEILLALYVADASGARLTTGKLAEWIETPPTTVVRWLRVLEEHSLVGRSEHPTDRRIIFIRLLDAGRSALDDYFTAIGE